MGSFDRPGDLPVQNAKEVQSRLVPGIGRMPFPAYHGNEPYIFVSYAHRDSERVFAEIKKFNDAGYHVWYDEGIAPGNEWTDEIADALAGCAVFVVMLTPTSATRENVQNEINFALDERKPFLAIHLEETELKRGLKLQIGAKQAILKYKMTEEEYAYKFTSAFTRFGLTRAGFQPVMEETDLEEEEVETAAAEELPPAFDRKPAEARPVKTAAGAERGSGTGSGGSKKKLWIPLAALALLACCLVLFLVLHGKGKDEPAPGAADPDDVVVSNTEQDPSLTEAPQTTVPPRTTEPVQTTTAEQTTVQTTEAATVQSTEETTAVREIVIRRQPVSIECFVDDEAAFSVAAEGYEISCKWLYKTENSADWQVWGEGEEITFPVKEYHNKCRFRCEITDGTGKTVTSETAELTIKPKIVLQPGNVKGKVGEDFTLTCKATGAGVTYWWFYSNNNGEKWSRWEEESMSSSVNPVKKVRDGYLFKCVVRDANGYEVESNVVMLTVIE